ASDVEEAGHKDRAAFVGKHHRLFGREGELVLGLVIGDVTLRGLGREPFSDQARRGAGLLGQRRRCYRARFRYGFVKAKLIAKMDKYGIGERTEISEHAADKGVQLVGINV